MVIDSIRARSSSFDFETSSVHVPEKSVGFACAKPAIENAANIAVKKKNLFIMSPVK
jgi:hypothetical protein